MIFLSDNKEMLYKCYGADKIGQVPVHTFAEVRENPQLTADTRFVFATWGVPFMPEDEIRKVFPKLEALFYGAGTVQAFARPYFACGIRVFSAWSGNAVPVAEYAVAQIILANKGFFQLPQRYAQQGWKAAADYAQTFQGNFDETCVGLLGIGQIGRRVVELLRPYRLKIKAFDPFLSQEAAEALGIERVELPELFRSCQTISNHLANNAQTQKIIGYDLLSSMPENATFINTGRGAQVDEAALVRAMQEQPGRTALLDVTTEEPLPVGHPLLSTPNILVTPHRAGSTNDEILRMGELMLQAREDVLAGRANACEVTPDMLATMA